MPLNEKFDNFLSWLVTNVFENSFLTDKMPHQATSDLKTVNSVRKLMVVLVEKFDKDANFSISLLWSQGLGILVSEACF